MAWLNRTKAEPSPLEGVDALLTDLDGVVYRGKHAVDHAVDSLNTAAGSVRVGYITNNASRTAATVAAQLRELGLKVQEDDVVTSPQAAIGVLAAQVPPGSRVLVVGGEGLTSVLEAAGFEVVRKAADRPAAVIQGFHPDVGWRDLAEAALALQGEGAERPWVATNTDWTIPIEGGLGPGNGTLVSAVHTAVGRLPVFAGKPEVPIFEEAVRRFGARSPLMLGDRLDTDILGANRAGIPSALVLTGVDRAKQLLAAGEDSRPRFILGDLRQLHEPYPATQTRRDGSVQVRSARVRLSGVQLEILEEGTEPLDLLRAACAAIWASGLAIWALTVPEKLYS